MQKCGKVRIYAMTHKKYDFPEDSLYCPLFVGAKQAADDFGYLRDDTGEHISEQNPYYCELTGLYWIWKNEKDADVAGLCHYRRYLQNNAGKLFNREQILQILSHYDVMTTRKVVLDCSYLEGFSGKHNRKDLLLTGEVIAELYPEYRLDFERLIQQNTTYFGNMMICKKALLDDYAEWLFTILFALQKRVDMTGYNDYQKRLYGFISEILLMVYLQHNHLRVYECDVAVIGEKKETRETLDAIGLYMAEGNPEGAKNYFKKIYRKRPDILMEASDTGGELKLCLQLFAVLDREDAQYGTNRVKNGGGDLSELLAFIKESNRAAQQCAKGDEALWKAMLTEDKKNEAALEIALHLQREIAKQ